MELEYDPDKSTKNEAKHGVGFDEAQELWDGPVLTVRLNYPDEPRWAAIGMLRGKHWTTIVTYRSERTGIISVRRSHPKEEGAYDEAVRER